MREAYSKIVVELFMSLIIMKKVEDADKNSKQPELHEIFNKQFGKRLPSFINLCTLKKKSTVLITGSTGLVGFNLVQIFLLIDSTYKLDLHIVVSFRNRKKYRCLYPKNQRKRLTIFEENKGISPDFIFHCESPTSSHEFITKPVEVIYSILTSANRFLELLRKQKKGEFIFLSSSEVYGSIATEGKLLSEHEPGQVYNLTTRASYQESKRLVETLAISYFQEFGVKTKIIRLSQVIGIPYGYLIDKRLSIEILNCMLTGKTFEMLSNGDVSRPYIYITDAIYGILTVAFSGKPGEAYNLTNPRTYCSVKQFLEEAKRSNFFKVIRKINIQEERKFLHNVNLNMDVTKMLNLGWRPTFGIYDSYKEMVLIFQQLK